jgi:hypothetical protein
MTDLGSNPSASTRHKGVDAPHLGIFVMGVLFGVCGVIMGVGIYQDSVAPALGGAIGMMAFASWARVLAV